MFDHYLLGGGVAWILASTVFDHYLLGEGGMDTCLYCVWPLFIGGGGAWTLASTVFDHYLLGEGGMDTCLYFLGGGDRTWILIIVLKCFLRGGGRIQRNTMLHLFMIMFFLFGLNIFFHLFYLDNFLLLNCFLSHYKTEKCISGHILPHW